MRPADLRDATFASLSREFLHGTRKALYMNLGVFGPATTRQLAARTGIDLLTVRPRITELVQCGLVVLVDRTSSIVNRKSHEGLYRRATVTETEAKLAELRGATSGQLQLV